MIPMLLRSHGRMGQRLLVNKHRAEIAHIEPTTALPA
jgi:hypothetical protein